MGHRRRLKADTDPGHSQVAAHEHEWRRLRWDTVKCENLWKKNLLFWDLWEDLGNPAFNILNIVPRVQVLARSSKKSKILSRYPRSCQDIQDKFQEYICLTCSSSASNAPRNWTISADVDLYNTRDRTQDIQDVKTKSNIIPRYTKSKILPKFPRSKICSRYPRWNPRSYQQIQDVKIKPKIFPRYWRVQDFPRIVARYSRCKRWES